MGRQNIVAFLKKNGLKQVDLARFLGITEPSVSKLVNGHSNLSKENMERLMNNDRGWDTSPLTSPLEPERSSVETEVVMLRQQVAELKREKAQYWELIQKLAGAGKEG